MRRFKLPASAALMFAILCLVPPVQAQDVGIAAVVNDTLISKADVDARVRLTLLNATMPNDADARARMEQQVLHQLIDETLERQEAKREKIDVDQNVIDGQYNELESRNKMAPGQLEKFLNQHGVTKQQLLDQIAVRYLWSNVVRDRYGPELIVGEDEVNEKIKELKAHSAEPANHLAEIFLPVSDPSQDAQVAAGAQHLIDQIKNGASFPELARQFSQGSTAAAGGDLGWVAPGTLPLDMEKIVNQMQPGTLGGPFRLTGGYYILILIDRREGTGADSVHYSLTQVVFPLPANATNADAEATIAKAKSMTENLRSCDEMNALGAKISPDLSGAIGDVTLSQMPVGLRPLVEKAKVAVPFDPVPVHNGMSVFMVCGRSGGADAIDRVAVGNSIADQKFQNAAVRYLGELRRTAYIDIRE